ncbi:MAG: toll/interleukin-1 receptor domain-containing protein, partial [Clostridia bacterium]|nr:toll/interleukin-1 receptor domain-containing protein [Clostridia bacterium]
MAEMLFKTKGNGSPNGKARVYFTCHPDDFNLYFEQVCEYIFKSQNCAVYYTADMSAVIDETDKVTDLESNNLFIVPVTFKLLSTPNRAMDDDIRFALEKHIPVLPLMMESGIDAIYSRPDKFGELQYLSPLSTDTTEVSFDEKMKKYLESVLVSDEMAKRVRAAFDAYIFLSYRKKDRKYANQLMRIIHSKPECRDIAIWYDEFLTPGESFRENIDKILADSKLFTLLVTPNLLEDHNFVMDNEYPAAVKSGINIIPAEMEETDKSVLAEKYTNLPEISNPFDDEAFRSRLVDAFSSLAIKSNDDDPEHNFLIGLAYLDGIDVEVNRERALELITKAADAELPEAMEKLFNMYHDGISVQLNYNTATEWAQKLYDYYAKNYGDTDVNSLRYLNDLSNCYHEAGQYHKALEMCEKAYKLSATILGEEHPSTLTSLSNLASLYADIGNHDKSIELGEKAYKLRATILGEEHPSTLTSLSNLASLYADIGNYDKSIELGEKAYKLSATILGDEHPDTLASLHNLACSYANIGNHDKSIELGEKAYKLSATILGDEHPDTLLSLSNIAIEYNILERYAEALPILEKLYPLRLKLMGEAHPDTLKSLNNLASTYERVGDKQHELAARKKLYELRAKVLGEEHPDTLKSLNNLAYTYGNIGNYEKYLELYKKYYGLHKKILGEEHPDTLKSLNNLAITYERVGDKQHELAARKKLY